MNSRAGIMCVPDVTCQRQVISEKPMHTGRSLQFEFEGAADVRTANPHCRHSRPSVHKWHPATARGEIVTQMRRKTDEPAISIDARVVLHTSEEFHPPFEVATIPMILPHNSAQHVTIRST